MINKIFLVIVLASILSSCQKVSFEGEVENCKPELGKIKIDYGSWNENSTFDYIYQNHITDYEGIHTVYLTPDFTFQFYYQKSTTAIFTSITKNFNILSSSTNSNWVSFAYENFYADEGSEVKIDYSEINTLRRIKVTFCNLLIQQYGTACSASFYIHIQDHIDCTSSINQNQFKLNNLLVNYQYDEFWFNDDYAFFSNGLFSVKFYFKNNNVNNFENFYKLTNIYSSLYSNHRLSYVEIYYNGGTFVAPSGFMEVFPLGNNFYELRFCGLTFYSTNSSSNIVCSSRVRLRLN